MTTFRTSGGSGRAPAAAAEAARDERQTDFELHLAEHFEGRMTLYDAVGRAVGCVVARRGNQGTHLCDLHLKGGELLIARFDAE